MLNWSQTPLEADHNDATDVDSSSVASVGTVTVVAIIRPVVLIPVETSAMAMSSMFCSMAIGRCPRCRTLAVDSFSAMPLLVSCGVLSLGEAGNQQGYS